MSSAAGIPSSSCTAAPDAQPAMSYSGDGEHSRLAISAAATSPTDNCAARARRQRPSIVPTTSSSRGKCATTNNAPNVAPHADHRRVQPRKRARQRVQLPGLLQHLLATKVCHNPMAHPAALIAIALDQLKVRIPRSPAELWSP